VTALGKLFGATAFRLALAILVLSAVGAGVVLYVIAWQVESVVDNEIARTIDAEAQGNGHRGANEGTRGVALPAYEPDRRAARRQCRADTH
jgi:hypothetical protein